MKSRFFPLIKTALLLFALLAALFFKGAVMMIPNEDSVQSAEYFSYLSKLPFAYGNFAPMFTVIVILIGLILAGLSIWLFQNRDLAAAVCYVGVIGFVLSLGPILLGKGYYPVGAFLVSFLLLVQLPIYIIERIALRREQDGE